jgi:hypothetical protein
MRPGSSAQNRFGAQKPMMVIILWPGGKAAGRNTSVTVTS